MGDVVRKQYQRLFYWIILDINMPVNFFSLSTGEQKGVVVMVVGGGWWNRKGNWIFPDFSLSAGFYTHQQIWEHRFGYRVSIHARFCIQNLKTCDQTKSYVCVWVFFFPDSLFTFEDENNHEDDIWLKVFPRILRKYTKENSQGYFYWRRLSPTSFPGFSPSCPFSARKHSLSLNKLLAGWYLLKWILLLLFFKSEALLPHWAVDLVQSSPFLDLTSGALCYFVYVIFQCWSLFSCPFILQLGSCHWSVQRELESRRLNSLCKG